MSPKNLNNSRTVQKVNLKFSYETQGKLLTAAIGKNIEKNYGL